MPPARGPAALGFISHMGGGAVFSTTVNSVTYSIDTRVGSLADRHIPQVLRIPDVAAGVQTITVTVGAYSNAGGALPAIFDYWAWEPPEDQCPVVVLVKQPKPLDYTAYGSTPPGPPTDTGVDNLNAILDDLAAEFGERVIAVDTSAIDADADYWDAGNVHPNANGHRFIAEAVRAAVTAVAVPQLAADSAQPRRDFGTAAPTGTRTIYAVGDQVVNVAPTEAGSTNSKYVTTGWVCTVAGAPGTWVALRALTGN